MRDRMIYTLRAEYSEQRDRVVASSAMELGGFGTGALQYMSGVFS